MKQQYIVPVIEIVCIAPEVEFTLQVSNADGQFSGGPIDNNKDGYFDGSGPSANSGFWE